MPTLFSFLLFSLIYFVPANVALAGMFAGAEVEENGKTSVYMGVQTEQIWHYGVFAGQNQHVIDEVEYSQPYMAGGIGYRRYGSWMSNIFLGLEQSRLNEKGQQGPGRRFTGLYTQLALMKFYAFGNTEYIASYSTDSEQLWTRLRIKFYAHDDFLIGPEIFLSRLLGSETQGVGLVLEKVSRVTLTGKLGLKDRDGTRLSYVGIEFYRGF